MIGWLAVALAAGASQREAVGHDAVAPAAVATAPGSIPEGPPREIRVRAGEPLQDLVAGLPAGSTVYLQAGRHRGPVVVDRSLILTGEPGAFLDGAGSGSVLLVAADDVVVRDLRVTGGGRLPHQDDSGVVVSGDRVRLERLVVDDVYLGIDLRLADDGVVEGCTVTGDPDAAFGLRGDGIRLWESDRNQVVGNRLEHVRDLVVWYSVDNVIARNEVRGSRYGTHLMHAERSTVADNQYDADVVGIFAMYSSGIVLRGNRVQGSHGEAGMGIGLKESDDLVIEANTLVDNTTGLYVDSAPQRVDGTARVDGNLIAANDVGVRFHGPSHGALFTGNTLVANRAPATVAAGRALEGVRFENNHWSGYAGYDLDRDGVGDLPYEVRSPTGALIERNPSLRYLTGTPALALVDLFGAAFPMFAPTVWFVDPSPLMESR